MTTQLLFYKEVVPVSADRHGDLSVKAGGDYGFAREVNSVPLTVAEIPLAAMEYTIVFAGSDEAPVPAILLGTGKNENLYVDERGAWSAKYIPAFVRRYPFVFAQSEDGKTLTLCVDEDFDGCNRDGRGERLFDSERERTGYLEQVLRFQQAFEAQNRRTRAFCDKLKELELLEPIQAQIRPPSGESRVFTGVKAVSRAKLKALDAGQLVELARSDELELIYLHLHSLNNLRLLGERLPRPDVEPDTAPATETTVQEPAADVTKH